MSFTDLVTRMMNAGAPIEAIRIAIEAVEAERAKIEEVRAKRREQKRKERAESVARQSHDSSATVADVSHDTPLDGPPLSPAPLTPPLNPPDLSSDARVLRANSEFGEFWTAYPHKVGRPAALRAFLAARKRVDLAPMLAALARYRDRLSEPNAPPPCNPSTWLNQDRWNDEPMDRPNARQQPHHHKPSAADRFEPWADAAAELEQRKRAGAL